MDGTVYVFRDDKYWTINGFPYQIKFIGFDSIEKKWPGMHAGLDTVVIVQEGPLRGQTLAFKGHTYNQWTVDGQLKAEDNKLEKITAIIQNSNALEPTVIGFGEKKVNFGETFGKFPINFNLTIFFAALLSNSE